jgi:hypothetical protein
MPCAYADAMVNLTRIYTRTGDDAPPRSGTSAGPRRPIRGWWRTADVDEANSTPRVALAADDRARGAVTSPPTW